MKAKKESQKFGLLALLSLILVAGFLATNLVGYFVSVHSLRDHIVSSALPLTGDTVYSEIQRDLLHPVFISSLMANDTFLKDWIRSGEEDEEKIKAYLKEIKDQYKTYSSFLVSENTRRYYYGEGVLKTVDEAEPRDEWYFRIKALDSEYETNVDPDLANNDSLTVFVNYKIHDADGTYLGATGVGLTLDSIGQLMERYTQKYGLDIYFAATSGKIVLRGSTIAKEAADIRDLEGLDGVADQILSQRHGRFSIRRGPGLVHLNTRYIPELDWYLVVEQAETPLTENTFEVLLVNLALCIAITLIVLGLTYLSIGAYQRRIDTMFSAERVLRQESLAQQMEISQKHEKLEEKNKELQVALSEVKALSGLLPICANCKCIRGEEGYWKQVEEYVAEHTDAVFSHGICPDCIKKLYPEATQRPE